MRLNKKTLLKSVCCTIIIMASCLLYMHQFPSLGHPPASWRELLGMWSYLLIYFVVFCIVAYIKIEDSKERNDKKKKNE